MYEDVETELVGPFEAIEVLDDEASFANAARKQRKIYEGVVLVLGESFGDLLTGGGGLANDGVVVVVVVLFVVRRRRRRRRRRR